MTIRPLILRQSPSGEPFFGNDGDVLTCQGGDVWEAEPGGSALGFVPRGTGAQFKTFFSTDQNLVWVTDFMTDAEQTDCFDGTLINDFTPIIQLAIDYALYRDTANGTAGGPRVRLPGGVMRIDSTIQLGYGAGLGSLRSCLLEGEGTRYGGDNGKQGSGTTLIVNFNNAPGIACQGLWFGQIHNLSLYGPNQNFVVNLIRNPQMTDLTATNWVDPTFPASASARFSVQCAIAIDPYAGPQPATHYPTVNYPAFLGPQTQYSKDISSNIKLENVFIQGFVAGIALQPSNNDNNGDFMRFDNVAIFYCAWGFVWGNSQARVTVFDNCNLLGMHTGFNNHDFGFGGGCAQILVRGASFNTMIQLADLDTQNQGGPLFLHCFAETLYKIGRVGFNASFATGAQWQDCVFGFAFWDAYGVPVYIYENGSRSASATFRQCMFFLALSFGTFDMWGALNFRGAGFGGSNDSAQTYRFEDCSVELASAAPTQLWQQCALNATGGMAMSLWSTSLQEYGWRITSRFNLDTGADLGVALYTENNQGPRTRCLPIYTRLASSNDQGADPGVPFVWRNNTGWTAAGAVTQVGRNISFVATGFTADLATHRGGLPGDALISNSTGVVFWVYDVTGTTISARAQGGFDSSGNLLTALPNNEPFIGINCRRYCPGPQKVIYGDLTAGSPIITNVVDGSGAAFTIATFITIGDWLVQNHEVNALFNTASFVDPKITAIDDLLHTITLNANALQTLTHFRLGLFTRPGMPNGTPTP